MPNLLAVIPDAVAALDDRTGRAGNAVARGVVAPAGPAVVGTAPGAAKIIGAHGVPGETRIRVIDGIHRKASADIESPRLGLIRKAKRDNPSTHERSRRNSR